MDIAWGDGAANRLKAEELLLAAPKSDVYVLPEMFSTGFAVEPEGIAEADNESLLWMQQMAKQLDAAIAGSVAVCEKGNFYNRFYYVTPDKVEYYDKRHLFTYGGEDKRYEAGNRRVVVEWRGVSYLLQVCYDLRFPVFSRNTAHVSLCNTTNDTAKESLSQYDVALYVASWPDSRRAVWDTLLRARAMENQAFVIGVNRVGDDPQCHYSGGTVAIDAYGKTIASCSDEQEATVTVQLDLNRLQRFREKFPVLADADVL